MFIRISFLLILIFCLMGLSSMESLPQDALKERLNALEGQLLVIEKVVNARWRELKKIDKLIEGLWQEYLDLNDEPPSKMKCDKILDIEEKLSQLHQRRLRLIELINQSYEEIEALQDSIGEIKKSLSERESVLDGRWRITLMPQELKGELYLTQNGTIVEGEYKFEGGSSGNVQGIFIKGHLVLERIDADYGRIGKFEAQMMKDGNSLKGSWYSYDIQSGEPLTGALVMDRIKKE